LCLFPVTEVSIKADAIIINRRYAPSYERQCIFSYQLKFHLEQKYLKENCMLYFAVGSKNIGRYISAKEQCSKRSGMDLKGL